MTRIKEILGDVIDPEWARCRSELEAQMDEHNALRNRLVILRDAVRTTERKLALSEDRIKHLEYRLRPAPHRMHVTPRVGSAACQEREQ